MENKIKNKETRLSAIEVFFFLILVLVAEAVVVYYGYTVHNISMQENTNLIYGVAGVMLSIFVYFLSFFAQGKWVTFFRNFLLLSFSMVLLIMVVLLKLNIDKIQLPQTISVEYVNDKMASYEERLKKLELTNLALKEELHKQRNDLIMEMEINRKAIHAQQNSIKGNASQIESGKKYQIIKNPF